MKNHIKYILTIITCMLCFLISDYAKAALVDNDNANSNDGFNNYTGSWQYLQSGYWGDSRISRMSGYNDTYSWTHMRINWTWPARYYAHVYVNNARFTANVEYQLRDRYSRTSFAWFDQNVMPGGWVSTTYTDHVISATPLTLTIRRNGSKVGAMGADATQIGN